MVHVNVVKHATIVASEDEVGNLRDSVAGKFVFQHVEVFSSTSTRFEIEYGFLRDFPAKFFNSQKSFVLFSLGQ